jgi:DNA-nicking Smr family endonuclease
MSKKKEKIDANSPFAKLAELKKKLADEEKKAAPGAAPPKPPPPKPGKPAARGESDEDESMSFHRLMSGVVPLEATRQRGATKSSGGAATRLAEARAAQVKETEGVRDRLRELADARFEVTDDGTRVEGRRLDLAPAELRKLRRGMFPIDARLDLHGMSEADAREAVHSFLRDKRARGERCVLVIHGRGAHSPGGTGILRGEVAAWLSQGPASEHVMAFATADADDGGAGAVYVMLRR